MDLIDILKQILNTKNELRDILLSFLADKQDNFSKYPNDFSQIPTAIHNAVATLYNQGYVDGYSETYTQEFGFPRYTAEPLQMLDYNISSIYYESYSTDILTDIMRDVLNYREQMKSSDKLDTESDYFPSYPDYLNYLLNSIYDRGYDDGVVKAHNDILPDEEVYAPTFSFSNNQFTLSTDQSSARLYFSIGLNGVPINYTGPVTITETCTVYYWAVIGKTKNPGLEESGEPYLPYSQTCTYSSSGHRPERELFPPRYVNIDNIIYLSVDDDSNIEYSIDGEDFHIYNGPIQLGEEFSTGDHTISMRSFVNEQVSPTVEQPIEYQTSTIIERPAIPSLSLDGTTNVLTMTCSTPGASMYYYIANDNAQPSDESDFTLYTEPITIESSCIFWYYSEKDSLINEGGIQYAPIYIYVAPVVYPQNVQFKPIYNPSTGGYYLKLWSPSSGSHIFYSYNNTEDWVEVETNIVNIYPSPSEVFIVYAYSKKDNTESKGITSFDWSQYMQERYIEAPTFNRVGNRVLISSPYQVYYSIDGNNPYTLWGNQESQRGLIIPTDSYLVVKAKAVLYDPSLDSTLTSEIVTETFYYDSTYEEPSQPYESEYFTLEGCSGFTLTVSDTNNYNLYYSYDKTNWTGIVSSVSGLDSTRKVYVKGYCGSRGKHWTTITFNSEENITISGNILSLWYGDTFTQNTNTPNLDAQCKRMFYNNTCSLSCQNLVMPFTSTYTEMFSEMFSGCTGLTSAPQRLNFSSVQRRACEKMFYGCSSLITGPEFDFTNIDDYGCSEMFSECSNLSSCGEFNLSSCGDKSLLSTFSGCSSLSSIHLVLESDCALGDSCCKNTFFGCTSLIESGIQLLATTLSNYCYESMFSGCSGLTHFSFLPATTLARNCYSNMFSNCTSLTSFGTISAITLADNCCDSMFRGCTNLTKAPELIAPELNGNYCYYRMFYNCSNLNYIKALFLTDPNHSNCTLEWVYGVADEGTFIQDEDAEWLVFGINGIPVGWVGSNLFNMVGTISSISNNYDIITITASNSDTIQYQINGTDEDRWITYTGPFSCIQSGNTICARCINNRGITSEIEYYYVSFILPIVKITFVNNTFTISNPDNYEYQKFYYKIAPWDGSGDGIDWVLYTEPVYVDTNCRVFGIGLSYTNIYSRQTWVNYHWVGYPEAPIITIVDNTIVITCSTPNSSIEYIYGNGSSWSIYTEPIQIVPGIYNITACSVKNGNYSDRVRYTIEHDTNIVANPVITQNGNTISITCATSGSTIYYSFNGSSFTQYKGEFTIDSSKRIWAWAYKYGMTPSRKISKYCEYQQPHINEFFTITYNYDNTEYPDNDYTKGPYLRAYIDDWNLSDNITLYYRKKGESTWEEYYIGWVGWNGIKIKGPGSYEYYYNGELCDNNRRIHLIPYVLEGEQTDLTVSLSGNIDSLCNGTNYTRELTTITYDNQYYALFSGASCITNINDLVLPYHTLKSMCYYRMFEWCGLTSIPSGLLPATTLANNCYGSMFVGCKSITSIPSGLLPATTLANNCYKGMFALCGLTSIPSGLLPATTLANGCYSSMFSICESLTSIPSGLLPATTLANNCYKSMFTACGLTSIPSGFLPATTLSDYCYSSMFASCESLTSIPSGFLPATTLSDYCYDNMFADCTGLISIPTGLLPATTLANGCYSSMFSGCISLTTAPELPAATLVLECYKNMFNNNNNWERGNLNYIKCLATDISAQDCLYRWVMNISSTGTFVKAAGVTWPSGNSGIPEGWTVQEVA